MFGKRVKAWRMREGKGIRRWVGRIEEVKGR